jgi:hypothetical protein
MTLYPVLYSLAALGLVALVGLIVGVFLWFR